MRLKSMEIQGWPHFRPHLEWRDGLKVFVGVTVHTCGRSAVLSAQLDRVASFQGTSGSRGNSLMEVFIRGHSTRVWQ